MDTLSHSDNAIYQDLIIRNDIHDKIHNSDKNHENSD